MAGRRIPAYRILVRERCGVRELRERLAELTDLGRTQALLAWDQQVLMPVRGAATRAEQRATLARIAHQKFTAPEVGKLLDELRGWGEQHEYDSLEASLIRVAARDWEKARRVPAELRADMSRAAVARPAGVGRGAQEQRLRRPSSRRSARTSTCGSATSSASTTTTSRTTCCSTTTSRR